MLFSLALLVQLQTTLKYHLVDATSQELLLTSCYAMLLSFVLLLQLPATSRYHLVDATSQELLYIDFMLRYVAFFCTSYTISSDVKISLS